MSETTPTLEEIVARNGALGWAQFINNCIEGDNYFRSSEFVDLIHSMDLAQTELAELIDVLQTLTHEVSHVNRYRDAERHPALGAALVAARTLLLRLKAQP